MAEHGCVWQRRPIPFLVLCFGRAEIALPSDLNFCMVLVPLLATSATVCAWMRELRAKILCLVTGLASMTLLRTGGCNGIPLRKMFFYSGLFLYGDERLQHVALHDSFLGQCDPMCMLATSLKRTRRLYQ